jgi:hypothetical protein
MHAKPFSWPPLSQLMVAGWSIVPVTNEAQCSSKEVKILLDGSSFWLIFTIRLTIIMESIWISIKPANERITGWNLQLWGSVVGLCPNITQHSRIEKRHMHLNGDYDRRDDYGYHKKK